MGKLRHRVFEPPGGQQQPGSPDPLPPAGACTPPAPSLQPGWMLPSSPLPSGDLRRESEWSRTALEEQNKTINHPCFTPAPVCRLSRVALCGAGGTPHQSGDQLAAGPPQRPDGQRPAHELPVCAARVGSASARCPGARQQSWDAKSLPAPSTGYGGRCPRPHWLQRASKARARGCCPGPGTPPQHLRAGSTFPLQGRGGGGGTARGGRAGPIPSLSWSTSEAARSPWSRRDGTACSCYPHKTLSFAVPFMTHGGRFPRAAAPALLQTVHSFLDVVCSSPAFLPIPGTHGWYEAMFSGSISFPAQRCWVSARLFSEELVAKIPRRNRPDVLPGGAGDGEGGAGASGHGGLGWATLSQ